MEPFIEVFTINFAKSKLDIAKFIRLILYRPIVILMKEAITKERARETELLVIFLLD